MVVQLERLHNEGWTSFTYVDELLLRIFCNMLEFRLDYEYYVSKLRMYETRDVNIIYTVTCLLNATSQNGLIKVMRKLLPIYHGFEDLGVLFYSTSYNRLYAVMELDNNDEIASDWNNQAAWVPSDVGISGQVAKTHKIITQDNNFPRLFNAEVDSVPEMKKIKNFLYGPIFQDPPNNTKLIGVMQFVNKIGGYEVDEVDTEFFTQMSGLYGLLALKVIEKQNILNTLVKLKGTAANINELLPKKDENEDKNLLNLQKKLIEMNQVLDDMGLDKRQQMLKNLSNSIL